MSNQKWLWAKDWEKEGFITCSKYGEHWGCFPKQGLPKQQQQKKTGEVLS